MPISYNTGGNYIQVTGYALGAECTYLDLYNADKAGTFSLHARAGIAAVDGAAVAVDNAERPADYIILGGATGDLYITITNWNLMTNATIRVTGTDRDGAAQTDDVVVNGNGNFNTARWFRTVTHTQVTVFNTPGGGSFDYDLIQGQWGVVYRHKTVAQFVFNCGIRIGDAGGTPTWFADEKQQITFPDGISPLWGTRLHNIDENAHFRLGVAQSVGYKYGGHGVALHNEETTAWLQLIRGDDPNADIEIYGSLFQADQATYIRYLRNSAPFWCSIVDEHLLLQWCSGDYSYLIQLPNARWAAFFGPEVSTYSHVFVFYPSQFGGIVYTPPVAGTTVRDVVARDIDHVAVFGTPSGDLTMIDADIVEPWAFHFAAVPVGDCFRQYSFNLRVVDAAGVGINGVTVTMTDRFGANVFTVNTAGTGDIAEQIVMYGYYTKVTGDTMQPVGSYSPHTVTLSMAGYITRTIVYTIDRLHVEVEELLLKGPRKDIEGGLYMEINSVGDLLRLS